MATHTVQTEQVTLKLPRAVLQRARETASREHKPVDDVVAEAILRSIPPLREQLDVELRELVASFDVESDDELKEISQAWFPAEKQGRLSCLLQEQQSRQLDAREQEELDQLVVDAEEFSLRRSAAGLALKLRTDADREKNGY